MMQNSVYYSNSRRRSCKDICEERSHSSQESTNLPVNNPGKNVENNAGSKASLRVASQPCTCAAKEDKVRPLSGKPFFTCILLKTHVQSPYQLAVPTTFYSSLPAANIPVVLSNGNKNWEMRYLGDRSIRRFDGGWRHFAVDNKLKIGDGCVFELMDSKDTLRFEVQILCGQVPDLFACSGRSSEIPIMID